MKHILITGSTDGIGKLTAISLAKDGHQLYLHGRNPDKLKQAIDEVKLASGNANISGFIADFADLSSVKAMANKIKHSVTNLDVLINNAGIFVSNQEQTASGFDVRLTVNYLAAVLLTNELSAAFSLERIVNLGSAAQSSVSLDLLNGKQTTSAQDAYAQSKLALTMWSFDLAKKLTDNNTNVVVVNPGSLLNTKMANDAYGQHWSSADKGANILHELAVSAEYANDTGKYFDNDKGKDKGHFADAHSDAYDANKISALVESTDKLLTAYNKQ